MTQPYSSSPYSQGSRQGKMVDDTLRKMFGPSRPTVPTSARRTLPSHNLPQQHRSPAVARLMGQDPGPIGLQPKTAGMPQGSSPFTGKKQPKQASRAALGQEALRRGQATPRQVSSLQREIGGFRSRNLSATAQPMVNRGQPYVAMPANAEEGMVNMELKAYGSPIRSGRASSARQATPPTLQYEAPDPLQGQSLSQRQSIGLGKPRIDAPDASRSPTVRRSQADTEFGAAPEATGPLHMQGTMGSPASRLQFTGSAPGLSNPRMNEFGEPIDFPVTEITDLRRPPMDATEQAMGSMDYTTDPLTVQNSPVNARSKFSADSTHMLDDSGKLVRRGGGERHSTRARGQRPGAEPKSAYEAYKAGTGLPELEAHVEMMENTPLQISQEDRQKAAQMKKDRAEPSSFLRPGGGLTDLYKGQAGGNDTMYDSSDPAQMLMPAPRSPGVDEDSLAKLKSEYQPNHRSRSVMSEGLGDGSDFDRMREADAAARAEHVMPTVDPLMNRDFTGVDSSVRQDVSAGDARRRKRRGTPDPGTEAGNALFREQRERRSQRRQDALDLKREANDLRAGTNMGFRQAVGAVRRRDAAIERQDEMIADQQRRQDVSTYIETAQQDPALARQFAEQVGLEGFAGKTSAEVAQEMENKSAMRVQLSENPQSILDITRDVREQFPSDPERQQEELAKLGISPDMVSSAMERTKPGFLDRVTGIGKSLLAAGARTIGQGIDGASENPVAIGAIPGLALLPSGAGAALGSGASQYILQPDQDEQDRLRARRLIQLNNSSR